jgi:aspartyl-tRNA(Asn)/glutamyl-tRNA(Gln) amidotransferase subunit A
VIMLAFLEVIFSSIATVAELYRRREITPLQVTQALLSRIKRLNPRFEAFITVCEERALLDAEAAERRLRRGEGTALTGIPIAVKDSIATMGIRTTANSWLLAEWIPQRDAAVVARLREAGAVLIGKTNLNEFGWSVPREDDFCPPPRNPWNPQYAAIGSSSGSGVALAAGLCLGALGTDGGGSVRLPAAQMGLVGLKPTHALISRTGLLHAGSISDVGLLTRTVTDSAILLTVLAGYDPSDADSEPRAAVDYTRGLDGGVSGLRVGVPRGYIDKVGVEAEVREAFDRALAVLLDLGAAIVEVELPVLDYARGANFVILNAEHYAAHEDVLARAWSRYGRSARLYHAQGAFVSAADYLHARAVSRLAREAVDQALQGVDLLALPTSPMLTAEAARRPESHRRGIGASFTSPFNLTGHPAVSVPCGLSSIGLPIGLELVGRWFDELTLLRAAFAYEQATPWHTMRPAAVVRDEVG